MAWDTEKTRRLLLDAAVVEFSDAGLAGARVDRIAERAGVNKERIYQYFGSKDGLFDAVVEKELGEVAADVPLTGDGPSAVGDYAARLFDRIITRPELGRLMAWEGLTRGAEVAGFVERNQHCRQKVEALQRALPGISRDAAGQLLLTIITLTDGWAVFPQLGRMFVGDAAHAARRRAVSTTASQFAQAIVDGSSAQ